MQALAALPLLLFTLPAPAQTRDTATLLGRSVCRAGDVDGDGVEDYAAGAPRAVHDGVRSGAVLIFSGATHAVLREIWGAERDGHFGWNLDNLGDVDGDGHDELLVAGGQSRASLVSTANGEFLWSCEAPAGRGGWLGDVDGDGAPELFLCNGKRSRVLSIDGTRVSSRLNFIKRTAFVGDVTGDGFAELARLHREDRPRLEILAGPDWSHHADLRLPMEWSGRLANLYFTLADLDGDGRRDYVIVIPDLYVLAFSGYDGSLRWWLRGGDREAQRFGYSVQVLGDVNGDGGADLAIGDPGIFGSHTVRVVSGADGAELWAHAAEVEDEAGTDFDLIADRDGDQLPELLVGGGCLDSHGLWCPTGNLRILSGATGKLLYRLDEGDHPELQAPEAPPEGGEVAGQKSDAE